MSKNFQRVEEVIEDEDFQTWFAGQPGSAWEQWLSANPAQVPLVQQAITFMNDIKVKELSVPQEETARAYKQLMERLDNIRQESTPVISIKRQRLKRWISVAAAVLLLAAGFSIWKYTQRDESVNTQYGEISTHQLPDGSVMMLNANSCATLGKSWKEGTDREVWLNGEAFFHIKKTPQKNRFVVHTNDLDVIVTGTQFNVWTRDNKTSVLLTEGSVTIRTPAGEEIKMVPGDFVQIDHKNLEKKKANEESILAWKDNRIIFDSTPLTVAARLIQEHYGMKVTLADSSLDGKTLSGMMPNDNLDILLRSIEATNEYKITRRDTEILISRP
jgi:transmembrane sensor